MLLIMSNNQGNHKFYLIEEGKGSDTVCTYGRLGKKGTTITYPRWKKTYWEIVDEKVKKGYASVKKEIHAYTCPACGGQVVNLAKLQQYSEAYYHNDTDKYCCVCTGCGERMMDDPLAKMFLAAKGAGK